MGAKERIDRFGQLLPWGFALLSLPWLGMVAAMFLQVNGAIFAFLFGPLMIAELVFVPIAVIVEILWLVHFVYSGGSLFDLRIRSARQREYQRLLPHALGIALFCISIAFANNATLKDWCFRRGRLTTDAELIENFQQNRADFERLLALSDRPDTPEAKQLVRKLKLQGGIRGNTFRTYLVGWAPGSESKGYLHSSTPPSPLLPSLDKGDLSGSHSSYREIDDEWYLFLSWH